MLLWHGIQALFPAPMLSGSQLSIITSALQRSDACGLCDHQFTCIKTHIQKQFKMKIKFRKIKISTLEANIVAYNCNPSTQEVKPSILPLCLQPA